MNIVIICADCGGKLVVRPSAELSDTDAMVIEIEPCGTCLSAATEDSDMFGSEDSDE